jgi:hypothetical protein
LSLKSSENVLAAHLAGEAVLLNLADKNYYRLNETAALIWSEIEKRSDREQIISRVVDSYDVSVEQAAAEIDEVLGELLSRRLIMSDE